MTQTPTEEDDVWPKPDPTPISMIVEAVFLFLGMIFLIAYHAL